MPKKKKRKQETEGYLTKVIGEQNFTIFTSEPFKAVLVNGFPEMKSIFKWIHMIPLGGVCAVSPCLSPDKKSFGLYGIATLSFDNIFEN